MTTEAWFDDPLVRPYAVTGGRTRAGTVGLDLITLVVAMRTPDELDLLPEYARAMEVCQQPTSVVEVAAYVDLPLQVVKIMLSDLITQGLVIFRSARPTNDRPSQHVLQAVLDGIRRL
jgi:predicted transcriptional regulator